MFAMNTNRWLGGIAATSRCSAANVLNHSTRKALKT
jgi:hypothetical protein